MKFVHAADIHLDSPLRGLERYEGCPAEEIRGATRRALENLVDLCLVEGAELLVIAGDLYDGDWKDYNTGLFFVHQVTRLTRAGVKVVWVRGNHDAASQITRRLSLPDGAFELSARRPQTLEFGELGVALHGQSYAKRDVSADLAAGYPEPRSGLFNLGVLHTALDGREGHDSYAPCSASGLVERGYDYWALGHVHRREIVCRDPWIVFPGNPQGRHARETGAKGANLVTVEDGSVSALEERELDVVRWAECAIDTTEAASAHEVVERVRSALEREAEPIGDRLLAARVELRGPSAADGELRRDPEAWRQEIRAAAMDCGASIWVEKIVFETRPALDSALDSALDPTPESALDSDGRPGRDDPVANLLRAFRTAADDDAVLSEIVEDLASLTAKLPAEYRQLPGAIDFASRDGIAQLLPGVEKSLVPHLLRFREGE
jgi:DNA repair exonuclease SbcCD nuclease subunit